MPVDPTSTGSVMQKDLGALGITPAAQQPKAIYGGNNTSVPQNVLTPLSVSTLVSGSDLLDLTLPSQPTVKVAGLYSICLRVTPGVNLTAAAQYFANLIVDYPSGPGVTETSPAAATGWLKPDLTLTMVWYLAQGASIRVECMSSDATTRNYRIENLVMQKIA